ncbi:MAG TPA: GGDEF domain-containing protein, partial [Pyrinomonadaceae bacterium]|nr:GGDEF domain-containing protein [Pyrinomonadaceae bacterium]
ALIAVGLAFWTTDFNFVFNIHAFLLGAFFITAFFALRDSRIKTFGWRVMCVALILLGLDFFHYTAVFTLLKIYPNFLPEQNYLTFEPIFDLVLEVLLGFGMIIILLEQVLQEANILNRKLEEAHSKLEQIAHIDPLTAAFNRHAFYGFLNKRGAEEGTISGCVGFFDIDDLKPINDRFGHNAGDMAIRAVVGAIRNLMRAEDLIYRWGGDEFFVIMVSMNAEMATQRMHTLERMLTDIHIENIASPVTIRVSYGFKDFTDTTNLEQAVKSADEEMYCRKQERKQKRKLVPKENNLSNDNIIVSVER